MGVLTIASRVYKLNLVSCTKLTDTDTYARAYDCCDALFIELGRFPTIDLIRQRIGVNSPATIKKAMNEWMRHFAERHYDKVHRPDIPAALVGGMEQAWNLAVAEAEKAYLEREQAHLQALAASCAAKDAVEEENSFLSTTLGQARAQLAEHEAQAVELRQQLDAQTAELAGLSEQLRQANRPWHRNRPHASNTNRTKPGSPAGSWRNGSSPRTSTPTGCNGKPGRSPA